MNKDTLARTIALVVVGINQLLVAFGFNPLPFDQATTYTIASTIITLLVALAAWWDNNSLTKPAIEADRVFTLLKDGSVTIEQILELVKSKDAVAEDSTKVTETKEN